MPFSKLGLSDPILKAIDELGYKAPTPIQEKAIPVALTGKNLIAAAQTGNVGETAAIIVQKFLRPAQEHQDSRSAKYRNGGGNANPSGGSRQQVTQNPNQTRPGTARAALAAAASAPGNVLPYTEWQGIMAGQYGLADQGQAAITAADQRAAEEAAAAQRNQIYDDPNNVSPTDAIIAGDLNNPGATAIEKEQNRLKVKAATEGEGSLAGLGAGLTGASPQAQSAAASIIAERSAEQDRDPYQFAQKGAAAFKDNPAESLVQAIKQLDAEATIPSDLQGKINRFAEENGISPAEAAYSYARAAESYWSNAPLVGTDGLLTIFGDGLNQGGAKEFAERNFKGSRATEARQSLNDDALKDKEVASLLQSLDTIQKKIQNHERRGKPVPADLASKRDQAQTALANEVAKFADDPVVPDDDIPISTRTQTRPATTVSLRQGG